MVTYSSLVTLRSLPLWMRQHKALHDPLPIPSLTRGTRTPRSETSALVQAPSQRSLRYIPIPRRGLAILAGRGTPRGLCIQRCLRLWSCTHKGFNSPPRSYLSCHPRRHPAAEATGSLSLHMGPPATSRHYPRHRHPRYRRHRYLMFSRYPWERRGPFRAHLDSHLDCGVQRGIWFGTL